MTQTYTDTFQRIVEEEKAAIEAEKEEKRLAREAADKRLKDSRQAAQAIRARIIAPMLSTLRESCIQGKVPLDWEVKPAEDYNEFLVVLKVALHESTKPGASMAGWEDKRGKPNDDFLPCNGANSHGSRKKFPITAGVSVVDGGPSLRMSVVFPKGFSATDAVVHTKDIAEVGGAGCDESNVTLWYQTQLEECVRKCVRLAVEEE